MSFQQGLSGLNASSKNLDVIGNNVANASTVGFKGSQAQFSDVYAASLSGATGTQVGLGVQVATVAQLFTQGNITVSNNPLDVAINGRGFYRMATDAGAVSYTRNGQFQLDKDGFIVDSGGRRLTGYDVKTAPDPLNPSQNIDSPDTGVDINLQISPNAQSDALATGASGAGKGAEVQLNLDSRLTVPTVNVTSTVASPVPSPSSYNSATSVQIYDSLGNSHSQTMYFVQNPTVPAGGGAIWDVWVAVDGTTVGNVSINGTAQDTTVVAPATKPTPRLQLQFDTSGKLTNYLVGGVSVPLSSPPSVTVNLNNVLAQQNPSQINKAASPQTYTLNMQNSTQFGAEFAVSSVIQDGHASGKLAGFNVSSDGAVLARYTNGQSKTLGFIHLVAFANPQGLIPVGNNQWVESSAAGSRIDGTPGVGIFGVVQSGAVEDSNVDLTKELVDMITAQRVYQANAQTIKTQDQVLNTLVNLR